MDPKGKSPVLDSQANDSSSSSTNLPKTAYIFQELEPITNPPYLDSEMEFIDQGHDGVIIAAYNWGDWPQPNWMVSKS